MRKEVIQVYSLFPGIGGICIVFSTPLGDQVSVVTTVFVSPGAHFQNCSQVSMWLTTTQLYASGRALKICDSTEENQMP